MLTVHCLSSVLGFLGGSKIQKKIAVIPSARVAECWLFWNNCLANSFTIQMSARKHQSFVCEAEHLVTPKQLADSLVDSVMVTHRR